MRSIPTRFSRLLTVAFVGFALFSCVAPSVAQGEVGDRQANVLFLHWNDFHGQFRPQVAFWKSRPGGDRRALPRIGGAASMATFIRQQRVEAEERGEEVVLTDGGDWFQGTIEGNETYGRLSIDFFARLGLDVAVIGNHEYDFGPDIVKLLCSAAKFPVLGANVVVEGSEPAKRVDYLKPFHVVELHGVRVAFVGLTTRETRSVSTGPWGEADFADEVSTLRALLPAVEKVSDVVVLLSHCGFEEDRVLAKTFPEIPLILGGHSHTGLRSIYHQGPTSIVQTYGKASGVYRVEARVDPREKTLEVLGGGLVELDLDKFPPDPETEAWIASETRDITAHWDEVIGTLETDLDDNRGARSTPVGNLVCDAFLEASGAQLAFTNKGGLRTRLHKGPLTRRMLYELLPFDNTLISMDMTGKQIRALLDEVVTGRRRVLEIGGGTYSYRAEKGKRVPGPITVGGEPLDDAEVYRVATSSFLARGGDGLDAFREGTNRTDHGITLRDVLIRKAEREGKLVADTENRVLFLR